MVLSPSYITSELLYALLHCSVCPICLANYKIYHFVISLLSNEKHELLVVKYFLLNVSSFR